MKPIPMLPYHHPQNQQYRTSDDATVSPSSFYIDDSEDGDMVASVDVIYIVLRMTIG
jgi:hypothetical protein